MLNTSSNSNFMTLRVDSQKIAAAECEHIREAIALSVVKRTAKKYPEVDFDMLRAEAAKFAATKHIVIMSIGEDDDRCRFDRRYDFTFTDNYERNAEVLERLFKDLNNDEAYYEDRISFEHDDRKYAGFCWKTPSGKGKMIGYFIEPQAQPGDWDYGVTKNTQNNNTTRTLSDLEVITDAGAAWNAAHAAYKHGTPFDLDAIHQMVVDVTNLKKRTESWKIKDLCQKLLARIAEYGIQ